jgi:hypothetical protein
MTRPQVGGTSKDGLVRELEQATGVYTGVGLAIGLTCPVQILMSVDLCTQE